MSEASQEKIMQMLASLSPEQRSAVEAFIHYLREKRSSSANADIGGALDEFVREHSELLRRLAQ